MFGDTTLIASFPLNSIPGRAELDEIIGERAWPFFRSLKFKRGMYLEVCIFRFSLFSCCVVVMRHQKYNFLNNWRIIDFWNYFRQNWLLKRQFSTILKGQESILYIIVQHPFSNVCNILFKVFHKENRDQIGGDLQKGEDFGCSVAHFLVSKEPKKWNYLKFLGKIGLSDTFLAPQARQFWGILVFKLKITKFREKWRVCCIIIHQMTKKIRKHPLYRLFYEIC